MVRLPTCPECGARGVARVGRDDALACIGCRHEYVPLLTVGEAAGYAEVSTRTITAWIAADALIPIPEGKERLIRLDQLMLIIVARHKNGGKLSTRRLDKNSSDFR